MDNEKAEDIRLELASIATEAAAIKGQLQVISSCMSRTATWGHVQNLLLQNLRREMSILATRLEAESLTGKEAVGDIRSMIVRIDSSFPNVS